MLEAWRYEAAPPPCYKRIFRSAEEAHAAHSYLPYRLKVYWCKKHKGYHVSSNDSAR